VRRCHGDAHLGNIVLMSGKPLLFDAIEFDPVIATTDVLYDLAFPLMDLVQFGAAMPANRLFNRYLQTSWDRNADALNLLPLFLSVRAAIRAHVLFIKNEQSYDPAIATQATNYFDLALRLIAPAPPSLVAVAGRSGTGKSVLARSLATILAPPPGALVLRSDVIRKELYGVNPLTALPATAYECAATKRVYRAMAERAAIVPRQGISVVLDAAYLRQDEREALPALASLSGATFHGFFLEADIDKRLRRIAARGPDASEANREVALNQESYNIGKLDWAKVDASGSPDQTLARAAGYLKL
jgi:predicted kinase